MSTTITLSRSLLLACLVGLLSACGGGEPASQSQAEIESHGHSHD
ncbi:hypothetical protein PA15_0312365 [Pseudomonas aeruginosa HB15]|jgi:hypothetical protein|nr:MULTISPECIES: hypothetical protein [Pseudomonas aeruginosa group]ERV99810.1 hypothetical protein Q039_01663 [Pseudomonas aeruginosa BWHPSA026]ESQ65945.1 hypothetical protein PA15_0312365 [Pseudomonas aeruginosa HB15]ERV82749.1 hypothetical protein Q058_01839 [Pseudomonas aeruginosa BL04]KAJ12948.1 hypothetical protein M002_02075 [Pseudomonas aeruginosa ID4365]MCS7884970.1 hypothetical protein [Pseudomonas aeruginosa]